METKRLQNAPLRDARILAVYNSMDALAERFVVGTPIKRFQEKKALLECEFFFFWYSDYASWTELHHFRVSAPQHQLWTLAFKPKMRTLA